MSDTTRRDVLRGIGAAALAAAVPGAAFADEPKYPIEPGAKLKLMRWRRFVQGDEDAWIANTKKFTQATGVEVTISNEGFEDIRPKLALTANVGSGPDVALGFLEDPHFFPDKLVDLTDLAEYLGTKYGGWYDSMRRYGTLAKGPAKGHWIGLPLGAGGSLINYRISWMREAGFETFPTDFDGFLKLCQKLSKNGHPPGFSLAHTTGDAETWSHNILWGFGGKVVDAGNNVVLNSPETIAAIEYMVQLNKTFIDGTLAWNGVANNNAFLEEKISITSNGVSIYYVARTSPDPVKQKLAVDMNHAAFPIGPAGQAAELHLMSQAMVFRFSKYPNAAKAYLKFMWEREQYEPWQAAATSYMCPPLKDYAKTKFWSSDPKYAPFREVATRMRWSGYAGDVGPASAACLADWVVVDMFAQAVAGQKSAKEAAAQAAERAKRNYRS